MCIWFGSSEPVVRIHPKNNKLISNSCHLQHMEPQLGSLGAEQQLTLLSYRLSIVKLDSVHGIQYI